MPSQNRFGLEWRFSHSGFEKSNRERNKRNTTFEKFKVGAKNSHGLWHVMMLSGFRIVY